MGIAFSNSHIVWDKNLDASSPDALISDIHNDALQLGWPYITIPNGYEYLLSSPLPTMYSPLHEVRLKVWNPHAKLATKDRVDLQFLSLSGVRDGCIHHLQCDAGRVLQLLGNICQVFISRPGYSAQFGCVVCGGVPWVPDSTLEHFPVWCDNPVEVSEVWWSCGDVWADNANRRDTFRECFYLGGMPTFDACWGTDLMSSHTAGFPLNNSGNLRLVPWMFSMGFPSIWWNRPPMTQWTNGKPLWFDPLLAWGEGNAGSSIARVRAQIWDAVWRSLDSPVDYEESNIDGDGLSWVNFTHYDNLPMGSYCGCLYLLSADAGGGGAAGPLHYAY